MSEFVDILIAHINATPGLTDAGLAKMAGLDNSTIRQMVKFRRNPRIDTAIKICRALGTTIEDFMGQTRTAEEREILRLVSQLPAPLLRQLLGYGEALAAQQDPSPPEPPAKF